MTLPALIDPLFPQIALGRRIPRTVQADVVTFVATQIMGSISAFTDPERVTFRSMACAKIRTWRS